MAYRQRRGLDAVTSDRSRGGIHMSDEKIALLKALAMRPSQHVAPSVQPMVDAMVEAGFLTFGPAGWMATAHGCALIEQVRARSRAGA